MIHYIHPSYQPSPTVGHTQAKDIMEQHNLFFTTLNGAALLGWSSILLILLSNTFHHDVLALERVVAAVLVLPTPFPIINLLYILEGICLVEVGRIAVGQLQGNLILGLVLHAIRITCLVYVLPDGLQALTTSDIYNDPEHNSTIQSALILYSWSITEVCRYPMYLFPSSDMARKIRLVVPIVTFPLGCALEAYGAFRVVWAELFGSDGTANGDTSNDVPTETPWLKIGLLLMVLLINGLLGPSLAYPAILKKGLPVLMGKKSVLNKRPKRE